MSSGHTFCPPHIFLRIHFSWIEALCLLFFAESAEQVSHLCEWPTAWTGRHLFQWPSRVWPRASREPKRSFSPAKTQMEILSTAFQAILVLQDRVAASEPLTWSTQVRPAMVSELIILSSHGLILILDTGMVAWKLKVKKATVRRWATVQKASHLYVFQKNRCRKKEAEEELSSRSGHEGGLWGVWRTLWVKVLQMWCKTVCFFFFNFILKKCNPGKYFRTKCDEPKVCLFRLQCRIDKFCRSKWSHD